MLGFELDVVLIEISKFAKNQTTLNIEISIKIENSQNYIQELRLIFFNVTIS